MLDFLVNDLYKMSYDKDEIIVLIRNINLKIEKTIRDNHTSERYKLKKMIKELEDIYSRYKIISSYIEFLDKKTRRYMEDNGIYYYENDDYKLTYTKK